MVHKKYHKKLPWAEITIVAMMVALVVGLVGFFVSNYDYVVETNAFFAPFEYYDGREIVGVDVEIVNRVAEKMGKSFEIKNVEFDVIIDNVEAGKIADAGAAGLTITPAREEKVNFTIPYYTSAQYIIYSKKANVELRDGHLTWDQLKGYTIGSQMGSTGYMFVSDEISDGVLAETGAELKGLDSHQLAADAIEAHIVDFVIADELAANFIVSKNASLALEPLYNQGATVEEDTAVAESYAIAVNKNRPELLEAFNAVLTEMLKKDADGTTEMDRLVIKYMGLAEEGTNG